MFEHATLRHDGRHWIVRTDSGRLLSRSSMAQWAIDQAQRTWARRHTGRPLMIAALPSPGKTPQDV